MKYINKFINLKNNKLNILYILYFKLINNREKNMYLYSRIIKNNNKIINIDNIIIKDNNKNIKNSLNKFLRINEYSLFVGESIEFINNIINNEFSLLDNSYISIYESDINEITEIYYSKI